MQLRQIIRSYICYYGSCEIFKYISKHIIIQNCVFFNLMVEVLRELISYFATSSGGSFQLYKFFSSKIFMGDCQGVEQLWKGVGDLYWALGLIWHSLVFIYLKNLYSTCKLELNNIYNIMNYINDIDVLIALALFGEVRVN